MRIKKLTIKRVKIPLSVPYSIHNHYFDATEMVFVIVTLSDEREGFGCASPGTHLTGETINDVTHALTDHIEPKIIGRDIRHYRELIKELSLTMTHAPAALASIDIALHDLFAQYSGVSLVQLLGQKHQALRTSVTIGILPIEETLARARHLIHQGFSVLKLKLSIEDGLDPERVIRVRELLAANGLLRLDPNQAYQYHQLTELLNLTGLDRIELIEQALPVRHQLDQLKLPQKLIDISAADESLISIGDAQRLASKPHLFKIFNIKLMKCGGVYAARKIAGIAREHGLTLMWGCNDESVISITAALHVALSVENTRFLDLDGSFDCASDFAKGGFMIERGKLLPLEKPGLGLSRV